MTYLTIVRKKTISFLSDPFKQSVFGEGLNSKLDCDFYTEDLCLGVSEYPRYCTMEIKAQTVLCIVNAV